MKCSKCGGYNYARERRPDGNTRCLTCGYTCSSQQWDKESEVVKERKEITEIETHYVTIMNNKQIELRDDEIDESISALTFAYNNGTAAEEFGSLSLIRKLEALRAEMAEPISGVSSLERGTSKSILELAVAHLKAENEELTAEITKLNKINYECIAEDLYDFSKYCQSLHYGYGKEIDELVDYLELALSFAPRGMVSQGLFSASHYTLDYDEAVKIQNKIDKAREFINNRSKV